MNPTAPRFHEPDDRLARAEAALRDTTVPDGPSADLIARTMAALDAAGKTPRPSPFFQRRSTMVLLKLAGAALLAAALAGLPYLATNPRPASAATFAEMAKKLQDAHTLSYRFTFQVPGQDAPVLAKGYFKDPGLTRMEMEAPQKVITIADATRGQILSLDPASKMAILQNWKPADDLKQRFNGQAADTMKQLRALANKEGKPVGSRKVGDVKAQGFRVDEEGMTWTVWVDAGRKLPLLMEMSLSVQGRDMPFTLSDFRIDPPLDDDLFLVDPPAGYTIERIGAMVTVGEEALINLLRLYADASGGTFPPRPDDMDSYKQHLAVGKKDKTVPEMVRTTQTFAAASVFLQMELKNTYGYTPDNVKLGDADKLLLWYRLKNSTKLRAIFGDLHAEDVEPDRVPAEPKL